MKWLLIWFWAGVPQATRLNAAAEFDTQGDCEQALYLAKAIAIQAAGDGAIKDLQMRCEPKPIK